MFVLDASVALAWHLERESRAERQRADDALQRLAIAGATVPVLWHTEVLNVCLLAERRGLATPAATAGFLQRLAALDIATDATPPAARHEAVVGLARAHGLSAYDATYLELAQRLGAPLATLDRALERAARAAGTRPFH